MFSQTPPAPILPMNVSAALDLMDIAPEELARQLTLLEYELYKKIKSYEFLGQSFAKKDRETRAPNITAMISRFFMVSDWVATEIVKQDDFKERVKVLQHFIQTAEVAAKFIAFLLVFIFTYLPFLLCEMVSLTLFLSFVIDSSAWL